MIYLDNASTTKMHDEVLKVYNDVSVNNFFNASAMYKNGLQSKNLINDARKNMLLKLGTSSYDLIFTGSATESNNTVILSFANKKGNFVFSKAEHPSVYNVAKLLENKGLDVRYVNLLPDGTVDIEHFNNLVDEETVLVSIIHVSNETGAINNIKELVKIAKLKNNKVIFHSDGVQAFLKIPTNLNNLNVDLYTISSHKVNGPKGVGALIIKNGININPLIIGGGQENNIRSGTENIAGICAFNKAVDINIKNLSNNYQEILKLKKYFINLLKEIPNFVYKLNINNCSPYILECSFVGIKAETLLHILEENDIYISNGSACSTKKQGNRILSEMNFSAEEIESSVRFSFSNQTTKEELDVVFNKIKLEMKKYLNIIYKGK